MNTIGRVKQKKVAIVTSARFPGNSGDSANILEIANQFVNEGYAVLLICPKNPDDGSKFATNASIRVIRIPMVPPRLEDTKDRIKTRHYLRLILFLILQSSIVIRTLIKQRIKTVYMRHSILAIDLPIWLKIMRLKVVSDGAELLSEGFAGRINPTLLGIFKLYEQSVIKLYSFFRVSTNGQRKDIIQLGYPEEKVLIIPVSVNIERIPRFSIDDIPEHTFGYFGVLERWQGVDLLIRAFTIVAKRIPSAKIYIIGDGSLRKELEQMAMDNSLSPNIIFVGKVKREELWENYFGKFRIVIIPRPKQDSTIDSVMPIKLVESLAAGKPIIASDIPVMREIPNQAITLVPSGDIGALADAMEQLSRDSIQLKRYSDSAADASWNYDITKNMKKLIGKIGASG